MRKIIYVLVISAIFSTLYANNKSKNQIDKIAYLELMYGFGAMNHPQKGYIHEAQVRVFFPMTSVIHELLARGTFSQNTKSHNIPSKYNGYEVEYRLGIRMDGQFDGMGMILGSAYLGLGYQNLIQKFQGTRPNRNSHFLYIPLGFWGEDTLSEGGGGFMENLKLRYGINTKMIFMDNYNDSEKFKGHFLFGGKIYLGVGFKIADIVDIFAQAYFQYGVPIRNTRIYGLEAGFQF